MAGTELKEGVRLFSYGVSGLEGPTGDPSAFGFFDSSGNRMSVNYVNCAVIYPSDATKGGHAICRFEISGIPHEGSILTDAAMNTPFNTDEVAAQTVSGICGGIAHAQPTSPGTFEWKANNNEVAVGIVFSIYEHTHSGGQVAEDIELIITYGNILPFNPLRLDRYDRGV
jgi:hypothetical protein